MKLRPIQLVCFALLLSTLALADSSALAQGVVPMQARYLGALFFPGYQASVVRETQKRPAIRRRATYLRKPRLALPPASVALLRTAWTMRPPSAHTAALQSATTRDGCSVSRS